MEGAALASKKRQDLAVYQAWHAELFAREKKLKKLSAYLREAPKKAQTPAEMLAALKGFRSRGASMNIRRVN